MSLRSRLQVSIIALVAVIVISLAVLYLRSAFESIIRDAETIADFNAKQVSGFISSRAGQQVTELTPPPKTIEEVREAYVRFVDGDPELILLLRQLMGNSQVIVESMVTGPRDRILASSPLDVKRGQRHLELPQFDEFQRRGMVSKMQEILAVNQDYEVTQELGVGQDRLLTVRMIISSALLRREIMPRIQELGAASAVALLLSLLAGVVVSQVAVRPLEKLGEAIDRIARGERGVDTNPNNAREVAAVQSKLNLLGEQFRGAQEDVHRLRSNIDQLLGRLEEAVLMFGRDDRLVMAGGAAERLLGVDRPALLGRSLEEIFPPDGEIGAWVQSARALGRKVDDRQTRLERPDGASIPLFLTVERIEEFPSGEVVGTLVRLSEAEARLQIESELDVSTRLAAIGRLTQGVAHEIKNPLNSIALHLEVLRAKLEDAATGAEEIEVISREIRRLDRVVKTFLDFTRPVELDMQPLDLRAVVSELVALVEPDAVVHGVEVHVEGRPVQAPIRGDRDLLKQALLNVLVNGIEAMPRGGALRIAVEGGGDAWTVRIRDEGEGIPPEVRERIYDLYFTTKGRSGSGIGLAMTFQVVQLHGGTIDFDSEAGHGTEFRLRFPARDRAAPAVEVIEAQQRLG